DQYRELSENNRVRLKRVRATRGTILDRSGNVLVDNRPSFDLVLVPEDAHDVPRTIASLTRLLGAQAGDLAGAVAASSHRPPFELPGGSVQVGPRRTYPFTKVAAHLFGYVGEVNDHELKEREGYHLGDLIGKAGAERYWENYLRGTDGGQQVEVDAVGRKVR